jgi:hypothetical protein
MRTKRKRQFGNCLSLCASVSLFSEAELLDEGTILLNIVVLHIVEQSAPFTYKVQKRGLRSEVLTVVLEVSCEVVDAVREQRDLSLCAARVLLGTTVLLENALLYF